MAEKENRLYKSLLALIPKGKEKGISRDALAETLCIPVREVSSLVLKARLKGIIICSDSNGYYFPKNDIEALAFYNAERKRAITTLRSLKTVRSELKAKGVKV